MYLDTLSPLSIQVGYGTLGRGGGLGYEDKRVTVAGKTYAHALSTHPPARLVYQLEQQYSYFSCEVALNDDVPRGRSHANFTVLADGHEVAVANHVVAGEIPRRLCAEIRGAGQIELVVQTSRWEYSHAVWLDPQVDQVPPEHISPTLFDCLGRAEILRLEPIPTATRCLATVVSPRFEPLLDDMLGSFLAHSGCQDALIVVFAFNPNLACEKVVAKYGGTLIRCRPRARVSPMSKAVLYSAAYLVNADAFLCLDADMLVLGDLQPLFYALDACPEGSILACREGNGRGWHGFTDLTHALESVYGGRHTDLERLLDKPQGEGSYSLVVNDGIFAAKRTALLALDCAIRAMPEAAHWADERRDIWWRNQFVFNLALARLGCGVELDPIYNIQLNSHDVQVGLENGRPFATWNGRRARILHFNGLGRRKYSEWRGQFVRVPDPLAGQGSGDGYGAFLVALRSWIGRRGVSALAWSFYGTTDGLGAKVRDRDTFPLFACLHYLIRSNGCISVLETGTARGVSAACLASAVAHHPNARVVSFDPHTYQDREEFWVALPQQMMQCIEQRATGSLEGMRAAIAAGEQYEAALLDSIHTEDHVWAEFQLATQLVCAGGLILIHDVQLLQGSVEGALQRIEAAGYGVVRLWTAECGLPEDDRLGLAVIENRRRLVTED